MIKVYCDECGYGIKEPGEKDSMVTITIDYNNTSFGHLKKVKHYHIHCYREEIAPILEDK